MNKDTIIDAKTARQKLALIMESERAKKEYESLSFMWMEHLFEGKCTQKLLINASFYLEPRHFKEVLEERNLNNCCGYPICDKEPKVTYKYQNWFLY
jgi:hypothetical protein